MLPVMTSSFKASSITALIHQLPIIYIIPLTHVILVTPQMDLQLWQGHHNAGPDVAFLVVRFISFIAPKAHRHNDKTGGHR